MDIGLITALIVAVTGFITGIGGMFSAIVTRGRVALLKRELQLLDESQEYRQELRADLALVKEELKEALAELAAARIEIANLRQIIEQNGYRHDLYS